MGHMHDDHPIVEPVKQEPASNVTLDATTQLIINKVTELVQLNKKNFSTLVIAIAHNGGVININNETIKANENATLLTIENGL